MSSSVFSQTDATGYHICSKAVDGEAPEAADGTAHGQLVEKHRKLHVKLRMGSWWRSTGSCRWNCTTCSVVGEATEAAGGTAHGQLMEKHRKLQMELHMLS